MSSEDQASGTCGEVTQQCNGVDAEFFGCEHDDVGRFANCEGAAIIEAMKPSRFRGEASNGLFQGHHVGNSFGQRACGVVGPTEGEQMSTAIA